MEMPAPSQRIEEDEKQDLPETEEEFLEMKTEYKQTKQRIKEMKRTILTPTDLDFYNFNLEKETKNLLKRMIKATEEKNPEWKRKR